MKFYGCFFQHGFVKQIIEYMNLGSLRDVISFVRKTGMKPSEKVVATITLKVLLKICRFLKDYNIFIA